MSVKLKIKSKHLALEPAIIRTEENKLKRKIRWARLHQQNEEEMSAICSLNSFCSHRRFEVRNEARATYLARAYIEGRIYKTVELSCKDTGTFKGYILPRIVSMVIKYKLGKMEKFMKPDDVKAVRDEIKAWCNE
jgi:hypothetical protein